jgi:hypothetical protein
MGLQMEVDALARLHILASVVGGRLLTNYSEINPQQTRASMEGGRLYRGMALGEVDRDDKAEITRQLHSVGAVVLGERPVF